MGITHRVKQRIKHMIGSTSQDDEIQIEYDQLIDILRDKEIQNWFEKIEVDLTRDLEHVIDMFIPMDAECCTMEFFLRAVRCLRGDAKSFDLWLLLHETRSAFNYATQFN